MVLAYADVIDIVAKATWRNNSNYINGLKTDHPLGKKLMDTHESTTEASANQMLRDVMNMRKEADESVSDCISRIQHKLNRLDALLLGRKNQPFSSPS